MVRHGIRIAFLLILAATAVFGRDFHVDGRVDVVPVMTVDAATLAEPDGTVTEIRVPDSQDRCLDIHILPPAGADDDVAPPPDPDYTAADAPIRLPDTGAWRVTIDLN